MSEEVENDVVETPPVDRLDLLGQVLDANLNGDDEAASAAFHDYLTLTTRNILNPEVEDDVEDIEALDDVELDVELDDDDINVDDIDLDQHIAAVATEDEPTVSDEDDSEE